MFDNKHTYIKVRVNTENSIKVNEGAYIACLLDVNDVPVASYEFREHKLSSVHTLSYKASSNKIIWKADGIEIQPSTISVIRPYNE